MTRNYYEIVIETQNEQELNKKKIIQQVLI